LEVAVAHLLLGANQQHNLHSLFWFNHGPTTQGTALALEQCYTNRMHMPEALTHRINQFLCSRHHIKREHFETERFALLGYIYFLVESISAAGDLDARKRKPLGWLLHAWSFLKERERNKARRGWK
jgi:hypothetical protein